MLLVWLWLAEHLRTAVISVTPLCFIKCVVYVIHVFSQSVCVSVHVKEKLRQCECFSSKCERQEDKNKLLVKVSLAVSYNLSH